MQKFTNIDFIYPVFFLAFGIFMIINPRTMMRKAKYDEESLKAESWIKKLGIVLCIFAIAAGIYVYYKVQNA